MRAHVLRDTRRQLHHRLHAGHFENIGFVLDPDHPPGEGRRRLDRGVEHSGDDDVDAIDGAAVRLRRRVEPRNRLADETETIAALERRSLVQRQLCRFACKLAVGEPVAVPVDDEALLGAAVRDVDAPSPGGGTDQHVASGGAGGAEPEVKRRRRHRGAFLLRGRFLAKRDPVGRPAGDESNFDVRPIRIELLGENLRQRGVRALSYLRLREPERDPSARRDDDPVGDFDLRPLAALGRAGELRRDGNDRDAPASEAPMSTKRRETQGIAMAPALCRLEECILRAAGLGKRPKY
jgi:hypothetical protein